MGQDRHRSPHAALLTGIVAAHVAAILALLDPAMPDDAGTAERKLSVFDVAPPVPPPPPEVSAAKAPPGGGSPGMRRQRPAARAAAQAPPARVAMDASLNPLAPPALPMPAAGTALVDLGHGGADGQGTGSGAATGPGNGDGSGEGGRADRYARAEWVERPPPELSRRLWPAGYGRLTVPVEVRVECYVRRSGRPYRCRTLSESRRIGFRYTALGLIAQSKVRPVARNGAEMWDLPVIIALTFDSVEVAPRIPVNGAASAPRAR